MRWYPEVRWQDGTLNLFPDPLLLFSGASSFSSFHCLSLSPISLPCKPSPHPLSSAFLIQEEKEDTGPFLPKSAARTCQAQHLERPDLGCCQNEIERRRTREATLGPLWGERWSTNNASASHLGNLVGLCQPPQDLSCLPPVGESH